MDRGRTISARNVLMWMAVSLPWGTGVEAQQPDQPSAEALVLNCFICHGTDGKSPAAVPGLYGKSPAYMARKLTEFKAGKGDPTVMDRIARGYTDEEIARIAEYFGGIE